jgi:hypothetical protein
MEDALDLDQGTEMFWNIEGASNLCPYP